MANIKKTFILKPVSASRPTLENRNNNDVQTLNVTPDDGITRRNIYFE